MELKEQTEQPVLIRCRCMASRAFCPAICLHAISLLSP